MKLNLKTFIVLTVMSFAAYAAYAETVTISTYYPSPYGSYQTLETNILQGAAGTGNVSMVPTGGNVGIRNGVGAPGSLLDIGSSALGSAATINVNAAGAQETGIKFQSGGTNSWKMYRPAGSTDLRFYDGTDRVTIAAGGNVGIGVAPGYPLDVNGVANFAKVRMATNTANTPNELQVNCAGGTGCYAYAVYS